jgi:hypothetical protein
MRGSHLCKVPRQARNCKLCGYRDADTHSSCVKRFRFVRLMLQTNCTTAIPAAESASALKPLSRMIDIMPGDVTGIHAALCRVNEPDCSNSVGPRGAVRCEPAGTTSVTLRFSEHLNLQTENPKLHNGKLTHPARRNVLRAYWKPRFYNG